MIIYRLREKSQREGIKKKRRQRRQCYLNVAADQRTCFVVLFNFRFLLFYSAIKREIRKHRTNFLLPHSGDFRVQKQKKGVHFQKNHNWNLGQFQLQIFSGDKSKGKTLWFLNQIIDFPPMALKWKMDKWPQSVCELGQPTSIGEARIHHSAGALATREMCVIVQCVLHLSANEQSTWARSIAHSPLTTIR